MTMMPGAMTEVVVKAVALISSVVAPATVEAAAVVAAVIAVIITEKTNRPSCFLPVIDRIPVSLLLILATRKTKTRGRRKNSHLDPILMFPRVKRNLKQRRQRQSHRNLTDNVAWTAS